MALAPVGTRTFPSNVTYTCTSACPPTRLARSIPARIASREAGRQASPSPCDAGPFTGAVARARRGVAGPGCGVGPGERLPLSLPLAGILLIGWPGGAYHSTTESSVSVSPSPSRTPRSVRRGSTSPAGGGHREPGHSAHALSVPAWRDGPEQQQQFSATVSNSTSQTVTWAVTGGSANGTIDQTGLYKAPASLPSPASVTITATSTAATSPGSATVTSRRQRRPEAYGHGDGDGRVAGPHNHIQPDGQLVRQRRFDQLRARLRACPFLWVSFRGCPSSGSVGGVLLFRKYSAFKAAGIV